MVPVVWRAHLAEVRDGVLAFTVEDINAGGQDLDESDAGMSSVKQLWYAADPETAEGVTDDILGGWRARG